MRPPHARQFQVILNSEGKRCVCMYSTPFYIYMASVWRLCILYLCGLSVEVVCVASVWRLCMWPQCGGCVCGLSVEVVYVASVWRLCMWPQCGGCACGLSVEVVHVASVWRLCMWPQCGGCVYSTTSILVEPVQRDHCRLVQELLNNTIALLRKDHLSIEYTVTWSLEWSLLYSLNNFSLY